MLIRPTLGLGEGPRAGEQSCDCGDQDGLTLIARESEVRRVIWRAASQNVILASEPENLQGTRS